VEHASAHLAYVADTDADAIAAVRAAMPGLLAGTEGYVRIDGSAPPRTDRRGYLERLLEIHPIGGPQLCRDRLAATAARTGVRHLLLMVEAAGERGRTLENIARFGAEVLPALSSAPG
jgi:hypothetical protein